MIEVNFENFSRLLTRSSVPSTNFKSITDLADKSRPPSAVQTRGTFPSTSLTSSDSDSHGSVGTGDRGSRSVAATPLLRWGERRTGISKNPMKCAPQKGATYSQKQSDLHQQATIEHPPTFPQRTAPRDFGWTREMERGSRGSHYSTHSTSHDTKRKQLEAQVSALQLVERVAGASSFVQERHKATQVTTQPTCMDFVEGEKYGNSCC